MRDNLINLYLNELSNKRTVLHLHDKYAATKRKMQIVKQF